MLRRIPIVPAIPTGFAGPPDFADIFAGYGGTLLLWEEFTNGRVVRRDTDIFVANETRAGVAPASLPAAGSTITWSKDGVGGLPGIKVLAASHMQDIVLAQPCLAFTVLLIFAGNGATAQTAMMPLSTAGARPRIMIGTGTPAFTALEFAATPQVPTAIEGRAYGYFSSTAVYNRATWIMVGGTVTADGEGDRYWHYAPNGFHERTDTGLAGLPGMDKLGWLGGAPEPQALSYAARLALGTDLRADPTSFAQVASYAEWVTGRKGAAIA
ncbi:hypothetical protein FDP22_06660 [Paroceanicella profunda]|uniref:Uncharacterized protein n=1 Tax=Paroceanicella profunda TaxID=2579971 RepID=A0A5B8FGP7_9RHOB|nr:hypothetical protein [Paroceanicella profunda]QDL91491.1 hypothetical protein FDP22_06660 [Paroceanicella profunda]